jgi:hypothetical protein
MRKATTEKRKKRVGVGMAAAAALAVVVVAPRAHAAPEATAAANVVPSTPNKLALVVGLASPWGELGVSYQRELTRSFVIETGVGVGPTGLQTMLLPKLLIGSGSTRLYLEGGPSLTIGDRAGGPGVWATGEIGFESSFGNWAFSMGGGAGILVAGTIQAPICFDACSTRPPGIWLPEIRLAIGRRF